MEEVAFFHEPMYVLLEHLDDALDTGSKGIHLGEGVVKREGGSDGAFNA
jgi:hypothetical protein